MSSCGPGEIALKVAATHTPSGLRPRKASTPPARFAFWYDVRQWERASAQPLFTLSQFTRIALRSIALLIIEGKEKGFREWVQRDYEWDVAARRRTLEEAEAAREGESQQRAAEAKALRKQRTDLLNQALDGSMKSDQIRRLVDALSNRVSDRADPEFCRWREWALAEADALDTTILSPASLNTWFASFSLMTNQAETDATPIHAEVTHEFDTDAAKPGLLRRDTWTSWSAARWSEDRFRPKPAGQATGKRTLAIAGRALWRHSRSSSISTQFPRYDC